MKLDLSLYLVLDPDMAGGFDAALRLTEAVLPAGVTVVQLRAPRWKKREWLRLAQALLPITRAAGVPLIINDHLDVALACDADGVHLGQQDLPVTEARRLLGPGKLIGLSTNNLADQQRADCLIADYLGIGPIFATGTKADAAPVIGLDALRQWQTQSPKPTVAIGGIGLAQAGEVIACGVDGIAVVSAICAAPDPVAATRALRAAIAGARP